MPAFETNPFEVTAAGGHDNHRAAIDMFNAKDQGPRPKHSGAIHFRLNATRLAVPRPDQAGVAPYSKG